MRLSCLVAGRCVRVTHASYSLDGEPGTEYSVYVQAREDPFQAQGSSGDLKGILYFLNYQRGCGSVINLNYRLKI